MDDRTKRWLAVQRDLGGDELILDESVTIAPAVPDAPEPRRSRAPRGSSVATEPARQRSQATVPPAQSIGPSIARPVIVPPRPEGAELPSWLADAPPVPGPGLAVSLPPAAADDPIAAASLTGIGELASVCQRCVLGRTRTCAVPGEGNPEAGMMVIGEGPGEQEDRTGRPFVGRAGELLDRMLAAIDAPRPTVYIANVVKCRPPNNRAPLPDERAACMPYLHRQISLVRPRVILALGTTAAEALLGTKVRLGDVRGKVHRLDGIPLVVTYHPAALLRNPHWKRPAWDDLRIARQLADIVE